MAHNYYCELNLHIVWHTKQSRPMLTADVEAVVFRELRQRIVQTPGAFVHVIGGTPTHVHVAVSIIPTITISEFVGRLKGATTHEVNQKLGRKLLQWQAGYGVVSFGSKDLPWVCNYIRDQKEHHSRGTIHDRLERITSDEDAAQAAHGEGP